jgi:hypothetical protein
MASERPGYLTARGGHSDQVWPDDDVRSAYTWASDDVGLWPGEKVVTNAVRGFPPAPGEPLPVYPPGPFAAWNRGQPGQGDVRDLQDTQHRAGSSQLVSARITPDEFDTNHSLPAIKDPIPGRENSASGGRDQGRRLAAAAIQGPVRDRRAEQDTLAPPSDGRGQPGGPSRPAAPAARPGRTRKRRQSAWLAIAAAGIIVGAVAFILVTASPGASPPNQPKSRATPPTASTSPTPPAGRWGYIGARKTDPVPLTIAELFPASFSGGTTTYKRAAQTKGKDCRAALIGSALQAAVRRANCTQVLRATYLSKTAKVMGTIGVFNLKNSAAASNAASKAGKSEFVNQLAAKTGPANAIGQGTGIEEAVVKGHYLVLVWAEATSLNPPKHPAGRHRLEAFMNLLIKNTVNLSLSTRMVDGKPAQPG